MTKIARPRAAEMILILSILTCVLEGALRKWYFRESAGLVRYACYFAKDFIFAAILFCPRRASFNVYFKKVLVFGMPLILTGAVLGGIHELNVVGGILSFRALIGLPVLTYLA